MSKKILCLFTFPYSIFGRHYLPMMPIVSILTDFVAAMLLISGAASPEELSESENERFEQLARSPLRLNLATRGRLRASGLLSEYQIASLEDYRKRYGDILSFTELSAVDGFTAEYAEALSCFVSLDCGPPGKRAEWMPHRQNLLLRAAFRSDESQKGESDARQKGMKYHLEAGDRAELSISSRSTYSSPGMSPATLSAAFYGKRGGKTLLGDFNARFGQGLIMWSGFSMSGFSTVSAFRKNASGLSHTSSFSPVFRGIGKDFLFGKYTFSAAIDIPSAREGGPESVATPVFALNRLSRSASFGIQGWSRLSANPLVRPASAVSLDWRIGAGFFSFYGEAALTGPEADWALLAGVIWSPAYRQRYALMARHYGANFCSDYSGAARSSSKAADEDGLALGAKFKWVELTLDAASRPVKETWQHKAVLNLAPEIRLGRDSAAAVLAPSLRAVIRQNASGVRQEYRADAALLWRGLALKYRYDAVAFEGFAWLQYLEAGYKNAASASARPLNCSAFLRGSIFCVDNWNDRIYCYERDIPGAFSVPAYYGRGYALSLIGSISLRHRSARHRLSARASLLHYERPTSKLRRLEIKIQYQIDFILNH